MITVDTCGTTAYSPLIPAIKAICEAPFGETLEIIMNHADAFQDLKEYLSEQSIGFREIYDGEQMTLHFTIKLNIPMNKKIIGMFFIIRIFAA